jgi:putative NADH-flavin reductase
MRLALFGATRGTGRHVLDQALALGHSVTALVRGDPVHDAHKNLRIIQGDATTDDGAVTEVVRGQDVVISALGRGRSFRSEGLIESAAGRIGSAMRNQGVSRLVFTSAFGLGDTREIVPFISRLFRDTLLRDIYADKEAGEAILRHSDLNWTFVHPSRLTDGPRTGNYRVGERLPLKGSPSISRADVAEFLLQQVDDPTYMRKTVLITY